MKEAQNSGALLQALLPKLESRGIWMTACKFPLLLLLLIAPLSSLAQSQIPYETPNRDSIMYTEGASRIGPPKKPKLSKEAKAALSPPDDLTLAYKGFLKQKNTGLIRLLPRKENKERLMVSAENPTVYIPFRNGGSYYSFSNRKHGDEITPEIRLDKFNHDYSPDKAFLGTGGYIGFITKLGDVAIEDVIVDRKEAKFLVDLVAPNKEQAARQYRGMSESGFYVDGVFYRNWVWAEANATYLQRIIDYDRADLLVAFRTVREEPDGSFVILWKILKKYPIPVLKKKRILYLDGDRVSERLINDPGL
jgi:hypothetical protein